MKISKKTLLFLFLTVPFIKPAEYVFGSFFDSILDIWKLFSSITALYMYIKRSKLSPIILLTALFQLMLTVSTIISTGSSLWYQVVMMLSNISFAIIVEIGLCGYKEDFLNAVSIYGGLMCFIMAVTMYIYYPDGMDQKEFMDMLGDKNFYFLGHDNGSFFVVFAVQVFSAVNCIQRNGKLSAGHLLLWLFIDEAFIYVKSGAAMVAITMYWIYIVFLYKKDISAVLNQGLYMTVVITFFFSVVILRLHYYFPYLMENVFHKSMTISGRTVLWDIALAYIKRSPFIGYGREANDIMQQKFGINHVHNIIIEIMYQGGIISLTVYAVIIFLACRSLMRCKGNRINDLVSFSLFLFFIISMVDYYNSKYIMYGVIVMAYNMPYLTGKADESPAEKSMSGKELSA